MFCNALRLSRGATISKQLGILSFSPLSERDTEAFCRCMRPCGVTAPFLK